MRKLPNMTYLFAELPLLFFFARGLFKIDDSLSFTIFTALLAFGAWVYYQADEKDKKRTVGDGLSILLLICAAGCFINDYRHGEIFNDSAAFVLYAAVMMSIDFVNRFSAKK